MTFSFIRNVLLEGKPDKLEIKSLPYKDWDHINVRNDM